MTAAARQQGLDDFDRDLTRLADDVTAMVELWSGASCSVADRIAALDRLDDVLAAARTRVADGRASTIAWLAGSRSTRQVAAELGLSPSAVAKAITRDRLRR